MMLLRISSTALFVFADDIILYKEMMSEADVQKLQGDLKSLELWENTWLHEFSLPINVTY